MKSLTKARRCPVPVPVITVALVKALPLMMRAGCAVGVAVGVPTGVVFGFGRITGNAACAIASDPFQFRIM